AGDQPGQATATPPRNAIKSRRLIPLRAGLRSIVIQPLHSTLRHRCAVRLYQKAQLVKKVKDASGSDLPMGWLKPCMTNAGPESAIRLLLLRLTTQRLLRALGVSSRHARSAAA